MGCAKDAFWLWVIVSLVFVTIFLDVTLPDNFRLRLSHYREALTVCDYRTNIAYMAVRDMESVIEVDNYNFERWDGTFSIYEWRASDKHQSFTYLCPDWRVP
jgi:hypothetical protein